LVRRTRSECTWVEPMTNSSTCAVSVTSVNRKRADTWTAAPRKRQHIEGPNKWGRPGACAVEAEELTGLSEPVFSSIVAEIPAERRSNILAQLKSMDSKQIELLMSPWRAQIQRCLRELANNDSAK